MTFISMVSLHFFVLYLKAQVLMYMKEFAHMDILGDYT